MKFNLFQLRFCFRHWKESQNSSYRGINLRKNYYKVLSVSTNATPNEIKKSYFKLAKELHPDVNPSGHTQFTQVQQAYNILSNEQFRKYYNNNSEYGLADPKPSSQSNQNTSDQRNKHFYEEMKRKGFEDFDEKAYQYENAQKQRRQEQKQPTQEQKAQKKLQDQIKFARTLLFTRNPIWHRTNAYMNYQERQERTIKKQKQFESLFPKSSSAINKLKSWVSKY